MRPVPVWSPQRYCRGVPQSPPTDEARRPPGRERDEQEHGHNAQAAAASESESELLRW